MGELLGTGGMGAVYRVRQTRLQRDAALKIVARPPGRNDDFALRFEREAQTLASLDHRHIVTVFDFGERESCFYLLMEFVEGGDLGHVLRDGALDPSRAVCIVEQVCDALQYAHDRGITHRDIKPGNLLIGPNGKASIADFGLAKLRGQATDAIAGGLTLTGTSVGTPRYMAPEQWDNPCEIDHRADIYSLGVVFYEMLTGERPVGVFKPPSATAGVDPRLDAVVLRALEKDPARRFQHASEMKAALAGIAVKTRTPGARRAAPLLALACMVALGLAATFTIDPFAWWKPAGGTDDPPPAAGFSQGPSTPGRLHAAGTDAVGRPPDLSRAGRYGDFIDVVNLRDRWLALRADGTTLSADGTADDRDIRSIAGGPWDTWALIARDGSLRLGGESMGPLPDGFGDGRYVAAALGYDHGLALTDAGDAVTFGRRYREQVGDPAQSAWYGTPRWPQPPPEALARVVQVAATTTHAAALHDDGRLSVWGWDGLLGVEAPEILQSIESAEDSLWALGAGGKVWVLDLPRNPSPDQPIRNAPRWYSQADGAKRVGSRCWLGKDDRWCAHGVAGPALFDSLQLTRRHFPRIHEGHRHGRTYTSVIWIEPAR